MVVKLGAGLTFHWVLDCSSPSCSYQNHVGTAGNHWGSPNIMHLASGSAGDSLMIGSQIWFEQMKGGWNYWNPNWNIKCDSNKCGGVNERQSFTICDENGDCGSTTMSTLTAVKTTIAQGCHTITDPAECCQRIDGRPGWASHCVRVETTAPPRDVRSPCQPRKFVVLPGTEFRGSVVDWCGTAPAPQNGFTVKVDGAQCATNVQIAPGATVDVTCGFIGSVVKIELPRIDSLSLCQVQIHGLENPNENCQVHQPYSGLRRRLAGGDGDTNWNGPLSLIWRDWSSKYNWPKTVVKTIVNLLQETARRIANQALTSALRPIQYRGRWNGNPAYMDPAPGTTHKMPEYSMILNREVEEWYITARRTCGFDWWGRVRVLRMLVQKFGKRAWRHFLIMHPEGDGHNHILIGEIVAVAGAVAGAAAQFQLIRAANAGGWDTQP